MLQRLHRFSEHHVNATIALNALNLQVAAGATTMIEPLVITLMQCTLALCKNCGDKASQGINKEDNDGRTPMHYAAMNGHPDCIKALHALGAQLEAKENWGCTPMAYAKGNGDDDCVKLLQSLGATQ